MVSVYELAVNPELDTLSPDSSSADRPAELQPLKAAALGHRHASEPSASTKQCPLVLQLVSHIALETQSGMVKADSMANRCGLCLHSV